MNQRRKQKPNAGDVVAVPLLDGSVGCGHVYEAGHGIRIVLFSVRARSAARLQTAVDDLPSFEPIFALNVTSDMIEDGDWPVVGNTTFRHAVALEDPQKSHTAVTARTCLSAYYGMWPWDGMFDAGYFEKLLVDGAALPDTRRSRASFEELGPGVYREKPSLHVPTSGAARVSVTLIPNDANLLGSILTSLEQDLRELLGNHVSVKSTREDEHAKVVLDVVAIEEQRPLIERLLRDSGLAEDTVIDVAANDAKQQR